MSYSVTQQHRSVEIRARAFRSTERDLQNTKIYLENAIETGETDRKERNGKKILFGRVGGKF